MAGYGRYAMLRRSRDADFADADFDATAAIE